MMFARSVAIESWQIMQVFTLGMPAWGPFVTVSWHVSVHLSIAFSMCVLWGKGMGCSAAGRMRKKSRTADAVSLCAGVKTSARGGACVQADAPAAKARTIIQQRARIRRGLLLGTETTKVI